MCNWSQQGEVGEGLMSLITDGQIMSSRIKLPVNEAEVYAHNCTDGLQNISFHM